MIEATALPLTERTARCFANKTRDRILEASLVLFNEQSFQTVTTAAIAQQAGVLEGTLWYHFPTKKDILSSHIELLKTIFQDDAPSIDADNAATIVHGIFQSYDAIWDFRYILRDDFSVTLKNETTTFKLTQSINEYIDRWAETQVIHSNECGVLSLPAESVENTSELILLIGRYWLNFSSKKYPDAGQAELRKKGLTHIYNVLEPHLSMEAKIIVSRLLSLS